MQMHLRMLQIDIVSWDTIYLHLPIPCNTYVHICWYTRDTAIAITIVSNIYGSSRRYLWLLHLWSSTIENLQDVRFLANIWMFTTTMMKMSSHDDNRYLRCKGILHRVLSSSRCGGTPSKHLPPTCMPGRSQVKILHRAMYIYVRHLCIWEHSL